ncbi:Hsp20/alpha crystallin family protein [Brevibacillus reuszeri]|uniref:Hsp20/alpha crystallin family protein n=1 Tax=Brevibacillus reuszeri TaxID=54915 RepID=UPI0028A24295|nr:Hsp20/alpha crystallin family protein [Brevibacillus reuszeri]
MKNLRETMKQLQKTSESLSRLSMDQEHPWKALSQMNQILDTNFWDNLVKLNNHSIQNPQAQAKPIVPTVKKAKNKGKDKAKQAAPVRERQQPTVVRINETDDFPLIDIFQTDELVILCCELPGFARDSLEVSLTDQRTLELSGEIKERAYNRSRIQTERYCGPFHREIELPVPVSANGMKAQYEDGLLELILARDHSFRERKTTYKANL